MYCLFIIMICSGKMLGDFMVEVEGLGVGISGQLIYMVNDMYVLFYCLKIIILEVVNMIFVIFSKVFILIFDKVIEKFRGMIVEGEIVGEVIFNFSKQIVFGIF